MCQGNEEKMLVTVVTPQTWSTSFQFFFLSPHRQHKRMPINRSNDRLEIEIEIEIEVGSTACCRCRGEEKKATMDWRTDGWMDGCDVHHIDVADTS